MRVVIAIVLLLGAGWYFFKPQSDLDVLMAGSEPFIETRNSGIFDVQPSRAHDNDIRIFAERGHITVVEFYDSNCRGCQMVESDLERLNKIRPDVAIKLIHMTKNYYSYWGDHYGLNVLHVPFTVLINAEGNVVAMDDGEDDDGQNLLHEWINAELRRD